MKGGSDKGRGSAPPLFPWKRGLFFEKALQHARRKGPAYPAQGQMRSEGAALCGKTPFDQLRLQSGGQGAHFAGALFHGRPDNAGRRIEEKPRSTETQGEGRRSSGTASHGSGNRRPPALLLLA